MFKWVVRTAIAVVAVGGLIAASALPATALGSAHRISVLHTTMTGAEEAPGPGDPDGRGVFVGVVKGNTLCYLLTAHKIEPAGAAHIHIAPVGVPGPVVVPLQAPTDGISADCITVADEVLDPILANPAGYYVNVHNADFGMGAIRGQLG